MNRKYIRVPVFDRGTKQGSDEEEEDGVGNLGWVMVVAWIRGEVGLRGWTLGRVYGENCEGKPFIYVAENGKKLEC